MWSQKGKKIEEEKVGRKSQVNKREEIIEKKEIIGSTGKVKKEEKKCVLDDWQRGRKKISKKKIQKNNTLRFQSFI